LLLGVIMIVCLFMQPRPVFADAKKPCGLFLKGYREQNKTAELQIALRCDGHQEGDNKPQDFPTGEPLVVGLTATTSDRRENDQVELEYDFALQNITVSPDTTVEILTFHAHLADISGKTYAYAKAWPLNFLQDCAGGRSGCSKFGYALALPASRLPACTKKNDDGPSEISPEFSCSASQVFRFKFR
jgi:hypothetical protein